MPASKQDFVSIYERMTPAGRRSPEVNRGRVRQIGRSTESVRYSIQDPGRNDPDDASFFQATEALSDDQKHEIHRESGPVAPSTGKPALTDDQKHEIHRESGPVAPSTGKPALTDDQRHEIHRRFIQRVPVDMLARDFNRTRTSIYRLVGEVRAEQILTQPIRFVDAPEFHAVGVDELILAPRPLSGRKIKPVKAPAGLSPYLASLYAIPLLTSDEEIYYFRKMNYLRFKAAEIQKGLDCVRPKKRDMDEIASLKQQADDVRNLLIRSNLRLVVSIATKCMKPNLCFFELISDGNLILIRAIENYDFSLGFKFSTYASPAIIRNYARSIPTERIQMERYRTGSDELFRQSTDSRCASLNNERINQRQHDALMGLVSQLSAREQDVIVSRFGLRNGTAPQTLEQVGSRLGVTRERIRQLESRALDSLRKIAETQPFNLSALLELNA